MHLGHHCDIYSSVLYRSIATSTLIHQVSSTFDPVSSRKSMKQSVFSLRTEDSSASQYFQFYGYLSQQQNMMQAGLN
jgi:histone-arginine methyltransferase CARM1